MTGWFASSGSRTRHFGPCRAAKRCTVALVASASWAQAPVLARAHGPAPAVAEPTPVERETSATPAQPAAAPAPIIGDDEVELVGGGFLRGRIVELLPNERVVLLVDGTGERREIPWAQVADVRRGRDTDGAEAPAWPREPAPASPPPLAHGPRVHLSLTRDKPVTLYEVQSEVVAGGYNASLYGMSFRSVCTAPCDRVIDGGRGQQFFLATGEGVVWTASRKFTLEQAGGALDIAVRPGGRGLRIVGAILLGIGIGAAIGGSILVIGRSTRTAGFGLLGAAVPGLGAGIPMTILGRTRYRMGERVREGDERDDP